MVCLVAWSQAISAQCQVLSGNSVQAELASYYLLFAWIMQAWRLLTTSACPSHITVRPINMTQQAPTGMQRLGC